MSKKFMKPYYRVRTISFLDVRQPIRTGMWSPNLKVVKNEIHAFGSEEGTAVVETTYIYTDNICTCRQPYDRYIGCEIKEHRTTALAVYERIHENENKSN